jgi:hypothetical protein
VVTSAFLPRLFNEDESFDWRELLRDGTDNPPVERAGIRVFTPDHPHVVVDFCDPIVADLTPSVIPLVRDVDRPERVFNC